MHIFSCTIASTVFGRLVELNPSACIDYKCEQPNFARSQLEDLLEIPR